MKSFIAALRHLTLPWGRTSGRRIVLDGDAGVIQVYQADGTLVAEVTTAGGASGDAGFIAYSRTGEIAQYGMLTDGRLELGQVDPVADVPAAIDYVPTAGGDPVILQLSSGYIGDTGALDALLQLVGAAGSAGPYAVLRSSGPDPFDRCDLEVRGILTADSLRVGRAQTPAPGAGGGTTSVAVAYPEMTGTPRVVITPVSGAPDLGSTVIRGVADNVTATGFTLRAYRSTNAATNWDYHVIGA